MKVKKFFGILFTCLGCMTAFIGLAATVLPMIQNDQLRLVLSSFEMPSGNLLVNMMNTAMTYALRHCYPVLLGGVGVALAGIAFICVSHSDRRKAETSRDKRTAAAKPFTPPKPTVAAVPQWHSSKAAEVTPRNPFAEAAPVDLFAPKAASKPVSGFAAFSKTTRPIIDDAYAPPRDDSAYRKTAGVNPYARPEEEQSQQSKPAMDTVATVYAAPAFAPAAAERAADRAENATDGPKLAFVNDASSYAVRGVGEELKSSFTVQPQGTESAQGASSTAYASAPMEGEQPPAAASAVVPSVAAPLAAAPLTAAPPAASPAAAALTPAPSASAGAAGQNAYMNTPPAGNSLHMPHNSTASAMGGTAMPAAAPLSTSAPVIFPSAATHEPPAKPRITMSGFAAPAQEAECLTPTAKKASGQKKAGSAQKHGKKEVRIKSTMGKHS